MRASSIFVSQRSSLDAQNVVAHLHESEQVNLGRNNSLLSLSEVELRVGESLKGLTGLFLGDVTGTLQVIQSEDVLKFLIGVNDGSGTVLLADFNLIDDELIDIIRLLISEQSGQILHTDKGHMMRLLTSKSSRTLCLRRYSSASRSISLSTSCKARGFIKFKFNNCNRSLSKVLIILNKNDLLRNNGPRTTQQLLIWPRQRSRHQRLFC